VSPTPAISCSSVSTTPAINPCHGFSVIAGVVIPVTNLLPVLLSLVNNYRWGLWSVAESIDPWLGNKENPRIGLSYWHARLHCWRDGRTTLCRRWLYPPVSDLWIWLLGLWSVYGCASSWQFQWHYRRPCLTLAARDMAILVWSSFGNPQGPLMIRVYEVSMDAPFHGSSSNIISHHVRPRRRPCSCHVVCSFVEWTDLCIHKSLSLVSPLTPAVTFFPSVIDNNQK